MTEITLQLSDDWVQKAKKVGILTHEDFVFAIQAEIKRRESVENLFDMMNRLSSVDEDMTQDAIDDVLQQIKAERRIKRTQK
jgi:hypothetical protein